MLHALMNLLSLCWKPFGRGDGEGGRLDSIGIVGANLGGGGGGRDGKDSLLWFRDIGKYAWGDFSMAVVQANQVLEDQGQIESGPFGTFVGVYDGHGGPEAAQYVCDNLFRHFRVNRDFLLGSFRFCKSCDLDRAWITEYDKFPWKIELLSLLEINMWGTGCFIVMQLFHFLLLVLFVWWFWGRVFLFDYLRMSCSYVGYLRHCVYAAVSAETEGFVTAETIQNAFRRTEEGFTALVSELWSTKPNLATVGSCCLVGVICQGTLFVASLGDSRLVLGKKVGNTGEVAAIQLSTEHNANLAEIRHELKELHSHDPQIVVLKHGVWRVKGIIQVSRSIGDVYMKHAQFNREPIAAKFRLPEPMNMPIMSADPTILSHALHPNDSFLIFASDGLWEHLSNEKAVEIVHKHPHAGSAKRLVKTALQEAARKREMRYSDLRKIDKKVRRHFHDDITVIVLFLNHDLISRGTAQEPPVSIRSALDH